MDEKELLFSLLEGSRREIFALGKRLFDKPELGFKETGTAAIIRKFLDKHGMPYRSGLALTGVKASLGSGGYHIVLAADMDALPVSGPDGPVCIHSCGHSIQVAVMLAVMNALQQSRLLESVPGRVTFLATPAEEYVDLDFRRQLIENGSIRTPSGKQNMIADGVFDDADCVLSCHVMGDAGFEFDVNSTLAGFCAKKVRFVGRAAHSGVAPHEGRNALHAASLCLQACAYIAEQFPQSAGVRLHPIISQGGVSMNAIPDLAVLETYLRANTTAELMELQSRFDAAAKHCAAAIGVECEIEDTVGYLPLSQSPTLCKALYQNMQELCGAGRIQENVVSGASGDIGDIAALLPAAQFGFGGIEGRVHSAEFAVGDPERAYIGTAKVVLGAIVDILRDPGLQERYADFARRKSAYMRDWLRLS